MSKKKKNKNFEEMEFEEIINLEKSGDTLFFSDAGSAEIDNSFVIRKVENFIKGEFVGNGLILHIKNEKRKNLAIFDDRDIVRLKNFLNKHF